MVGVSFNKNMYGTQGYRPQDLYNFELEVPCALISKIVFLIFPPTKNMPKTTLIRK